MEFSDGITLRKNSTVENTELLDLLRFVQTVDGNVPLEQVTDIGYPDENGLDMSDMCFYKIKKLSYDKEFPRREAFENVLNYLDNDAYNFVYILSGDDSGVELLVGIVKNHRRNIDTLSTVNYGESIEKAFKGNFDGSDLQKLKSQELHDKLIRQVGIYKKAGIISGIPSMNEADNTDEQDFQGIDRLINSMLGQTWRIVVVCEPTNSKELLQERNRVYELYNKLSLYSKSTIQQGFNLGDSHTDGINESRSRDIGTNFTESNTDSEGTANSSGTKNSSSSHQTSKGGSESRSHSKGVNQSYSRNRGISGATTVEIANKHVQDLMKYIDEDLLPRLKEGYGKGMYKTSLFYMADKVTTANRLNLSIKSLFRGNRSGFSPLIAQELDLKNRLNRKALASYQNCFCESDAYILDGVTLMSRPVDPLYGIGLSSYLTAEEAGILAGLPQKEVPGIPLLEGVDFGLNVRKDNKTGEDEKKIELGCLVQRGIDLNIPFALQQKAMTKHTLVAGVTGSGKTTTCQKLLAAASAPFLVIEPAKTEYRVLALDKYRKQFGEVHVFTLGNEGGSPFRLNPFELVEGENVSGHIDVVKATFTSAFPMEGSMPQMMEEAIIKCYENKGWSLDNNSNDLYPDPFHKDKERAFPIISELLEELKIVAKAKGFGERLENEYLGSLVSRLSNLTVGVKGRMLNCPYSTDFRFIAYNNVVLEMEEMKSPEDKALLMGFILSRLSAVIKQEYKRDKNYRHLTLIEEAHRLLSKVDYGDSGSKKTAVETFTDLLAEIRKYGEGLIIADQIPNKLASEVLKNTNTKIIHKILARDDKEAVGDTMLMDDKQKEYLSALAPGHVIVFTENTPKPIHVHVQRETDTDKDEISEVDLRSKFMENRDIYGSIYEELELIPHYDLFCVLSEGIRTNALKPEVFPKFRKAVESIAGMPYFAAHEDPKREVIRRFYCRGLRLRGLVGYEDVTEEAVDFLLAACNDRPAEHDHRRLRKIFY